MSEYTEDGHFGKIYSACAFDGSDAFGLQEGPCYSSKDCAGKVTGRGNKVPALSAS